MVLEWSGLSNRLYTLYGLTSLTDLAESWTPISNATHLPGVNGVMMYTDTVDQTSGRFYQLSVQPE